MYWITFQTLIKKWYLLDLEYNESEHLKISNLYMAFGSITLWEIDGETAETVADFIFLGFKITADGDCGKLWQT